MSDERILGSGDFVEHMLAEADASTKAQFPARERDEKVRELITRLCVKENINLKELISGSRRPPVSALRSTAATQLVEHPGVSLAEAARVLGVTTLAISKTLQKTKGQKEFN